MKRKRRFWSDEEKRRVVAETRVSGGSVAAVARRYDINANQVFNWLRDARYLSSSAADEAATFVPVKVIGDDPALRLERDNNCGSIEIALATGHRLRVTGPFDPEALALLARRLGS